MAVTPALAPGAKTRIMVLLSLTAAGTFASYWVFGAPETLVITGLLVLIFAYLLLGVALQRRFEARRLAPVLKEIAEAAHHFDLITDRGGTILARSARADLILGHADGVLEGQGFGDIVESLEDRIALKEALQMASIGRGGDWTRSMAILDERAKTHTMQVTLHSAPTKAGRKEGLVVIRLLIA